MTIEYSKYMYIIDKNHVLEKLRTLDFGLHYTYIHIIESNMIVKEKHCDSRTFSLWHDRLNT